MRIDKFLKVTQIIKRRTVANEAADNGRIKANGRVVKPSYEVKVGDVIEIQFGNSVSKFEIIGIPIKQKVPLDQTVKLL
jgi:ribosomal 50S subunit-recycling heat shock protein